VSAHHPTPVRVLVTKVGLDGHDRGVKVVARMLRDAGFEVVYGGLRQTPETIAEAALQEDVDVVGLSMHSGGHLTLVPAVIEALRRRALDVAVVVGGIVPVRDREVLLREGVTEVLTPGASRDDVVAAMVRASNRRFESPASDVSSGPDA
jgi:methylmalonyl-CoA mutase cobalamin-binding domain/chain